MHIAAWTALLCFITRYDEASGTGSSTIIITNGPWSSGSGYTTQGYCMLDLDSTPNGQPYSPGIVDIQVVLNIPIYYITEWTFYRFPTLQSSTVNLKNKYHINMNELPFKMEFQITYQYDSQNPFPSGTCYCLASACGTSSSTIIVTNGPWTSGGSYTIQGYCMLDIDPTPNGQPYLPSTVDVQVVMNIAFEAITDWTFYPVSSTPPVSTVNLKNKYYINMDQLPFKMDFQITHDSPTPFPSGTCQFPTSTATTTSSTTTTTASPAGDVCQSYSAVQSFPGSGYNLYEVLCKSILFYEAQRSGDLPSNQRVTWRMDSTLLDGQDNNVDLTGGWFDAGDYVKFGYPMASSTTILLWGLLEWPNAYTAAGQTDYMHDSVRWPLEYFLKCWKSGQQRFYAQVGDGDIDHSIVLRPEDLDADSSERPSFYVDSSNGGTDVTAETAAAMAAGYLVFKDTDSSFASQLLTAAQSLFTFANTYRNPYSDVVTDAQSFYASYCCGEIPSDTIADELVQAALWLYKATNDNSYLTTANNLYNEHSGYFSGTPWAYSWSDKRPAVNSLMFEINGNTAYADRVRDFLVSWRPGGDVTYTPKGLAWRQQWGPLRFAANAAFLSMVALKQEIISHTDISQGQVLNPYAQIKYMLGDFGHSLVVGFGNNPPIRPHHKSSLCAPKPAPCDWAEFNSDVPNYYTLYGALVGGPDSDDTYVDSRLNYEMTEVACDYNAGFQSAIAGIISQPDPSA